MPPELQKQVDELAEQAVDDWIEQKHAREVVITPEPCELCNGTGYIKSNTIEFEGDCPECSAD